MLRCSCHLQKRHHLHLDVLSGGMLKLEQVNKINPLLMLLATLQFHDKPIWIIHIMINPEYHSYSDHLISFLGPGLSGDVIPQLRLLILLLLQYETLIVYCIEM